MDGRTDESSSLYGMRSTATVSVAGSGNVYVADGTLFRQISTDISQGRHLGAGGIGPLIFFKTF